ncbi:MAG: beta-hexosaminidase, partial [Cytophagaceae bacterium]
MPLQTNLFYYLRNALCLVLLGLGPAAHAQKPLGTLLPIIPQPVRVQLNGGPFVLTSRTSVHTGPGLAPDAAALFRQYVRTVGRLALSEKPGAAVDGIYLRLDSQAVTHREGYRLVVAPHRITVTGHDAAGVFYGLQSLSQLLPAGTGGALRVPGCVVEDYPRFGYRGLHLDVSRHLFPLPVLKKWLDVLAFYKINTFH